MASSSDQIKQYKTKIKDLNASIAADREQLSKMDSFFSSSSQDDIEAMRKRISKKQDQLEQVCHDYDKYSIMQETSYDSNLAELATPSMATLYEYDYDTATYKKRADDGTSDKFSSSLELASQYGKTKSDNASSAGSSSDAASNESTDSISNSIVNGVTGTVDSATNAVKGAVNTATGTVKGAVNTATGFVSNLANTAEQAVGKLTAGLSNAVTGIKDGISKLFSSDDSSDKKALTSKSSDKGPAETDTKVKTLDAKSNEAVKQPVAFKSAETKVVTNPTKSAETKTKDDSLPKTGKLAAAAKSIGSSIKKTISSVTGAVKSVTSTLKSAINTAKSVVKKVKDTVNQVKKAVLEPIRSTAKAINATVKNVVSSVKSFAQPFIDGYHEVIDGTKGFINDIADALPGPLGAKLKSKADSFIENKIEAKVEAKLAAFNNTLDKVSGLGLKGDLGEIYARLLGRESSSGKHSDYIHYLVDDNGSPVNELYGDNAVGTVTGLYGAASSVCPNVTVPNISDRSIDSRTYGMLLALAAKNGMSDLIDQMGSCGKNTGCFTDATRSVLSDQLPEIAITGDVNTYISVFNLVGKNNVATPADDIRTLIANDTNADDSSVSKYDWLAKQSGCDSVKKLCTSDTGIKNIKAFDMNKVSFMTCSNTKVMDACIGRANRTLIQAMRVTN